MNARMAQSVGPQLHGAHVIIKQGNMVKRTGLIGGNRCPVKTVLGKQRDPILKTTLVKTVQLGMNKGRNVIDPDPICVLTLRFHISHVKPPALSNRPYT